MTVENGFTPEVESKINFANALERLSDVENPTPLLPEEINVAEIRNELLSAKIAIDLIESNPDLQNSIMSSQFRDKDQGKGPAVIAVLGPDGYQKYFAWAMEESKNQPTLSAGDESSKCRGLMQFLGETIALTSGQMTPEDFCYKTNLRVGKKFKENAEISEKFNLPKDEAGIKELKQTSSVPKGSIARAYQEILSLNTV